VPKVEGDHKFVATARLEVMAGKVVRAVEGAAQHLPDASSSAEGVFSCAAEGAQTPTGKISDEPEAACQDRLTRSFSIRMSTCVWSAVIRFK
jgi:hypothetical protein